MANTGVVGEHGSPAPSAAAPAAARRAAVRPYYVVAGLALVAAAAYGISILVARGKESTDDAQLEADAVIVSARVAGAVLRVAASDNQVVKKGDLLVEIDPAELAARVRQAQAQLAAARAQAQAADAQVGIVEATSKGGLTAARAQLSGTAASVAGADAQIEAAKAALSRAESDAEKADTDLARGQALRKDEAIPQAQLDAYLAAAHSARAQVSQTRAQLAAALDSKRSAQTQIAEAQGRVEQSAPVDAQLAAAQAGADLAHANTDAADAALALATLQRSYAHIVAPADGHVARFAVREGQLVQAGQQIVTLVPSATYVVANFKETQVGGMRPGQRAEISIDAFPGRSFEGKVESTSPATGARFSLLPADNASGNFVKVVQRVPVKITWAGVPADVSLSAGLSADVTVFTR